MVRCHQAIIYYLSQCWPDLCLRMALPGTLSYILYLHKPEWINIIVPVRLKCLAHLGRVSHICVMKNSPHFPSGAYKRRKSIYFSYRFGERPTKQCQSKMSLLECSCIELTKNQSLTLRKHWSRCDEFEIIRETRSVGHVALLAVTRAAILVPYGDFPSPKIRQPRDIFMMGIHILMKCGVTWEISLSPNRH